MNKEKILSFLKNNGKINWLLIAGLAGIFLIGLSGLFSDRQTHTNPSSAQSYVDTQEYATQLEDRLEKMISQIQGVGKSKVMVTMEQGTEYVYATEEKNSTQTDQTSENDRFSTENKTTDEETYIMIATDDGDKPLLLTQLAPRVKGMIVVCDGGGDAAVAQTVTKALATALNISENRICVVKGTIS